MPKKDTATAVLSMLSTAGAQTRRIGESPEPVEEIVDAPVVTVTEQPQASVSPLYSAPQPLPAEAASSKAPRTLRLRPAAASRLRDAWLAAKRDDVLLTAQDFASDLVEEALARRALLHDATS
ncbi:hypothetical protein GGC64_005987 [Mycobacterium sp. OAS707]|uniref:hypothetical protein n=1 Tax=Mycobacterium sp. OAS707 TaxID=2663822 RepID=UPI001A03881F|nr:hypothetical protein [Mycobacterium sp. OAS707]MBE1551900.1 hypothetical protein [Mycobacterium sp. OAS707]